MSKKNESKSDSNTGGETIETYTSVELQEKLDRMKESREKMLEEANRSIAQLDGAIAFVTQLLAGQLEEPTEEKVVH